MTPTTKAIGALLDTAGFDRGISNPPELARSGYAVIPNRPGDGIVLVNWWEHPAGLVGERAERARWLDQYAAAIRAGGFAARSAWHGDSEELGLSPDYLVVTAASREGSQS